MAVTTTAQRILVVYGTASIAFGMLLGIPLSRARMAAPVAPRHLVTAHLASLIQGPVHIGFAVAAGTSTLSPWIETADAILLVCGSALFVSGALLNWLGGVDDHFAARSPGWYLLSASGGPHVTGSIVLLVGVIVGLAR